MCLVWKYGEYNKSYEPGSKKCPLEVLSIFTFGIVRWRVGKIAADFYPQRLKNRLLQPVYRLRIVTQLVEMLACFLPCSGVTDKWHLSRSCYAGPLKWRENNGAKMTSWSRKKFPVRVSEAKLVKITLPCFKSLTAADLSPKDDFDQLFNFQGPVISECTIVVTKTVGTREKEKENETSTKMHLPRIVFMVSVYFWCDGTFPCIGNIWVTAVPSLDPCPPSDVDTRKLSLQQHCTGKLVGHSPKVACIPLTTFQFFTSDSETGLLGAPRDWATGFSSRLSHRRTWTARSKLSLVCLIAVPES